MVTPSEADLARIRADAAKVAAARAIDRPEPPFESGYAWPARGIITGVYGSQRILNGEPRRPHFGIDIAAPTGTPVTAAADGVVAMADDLYFTGGTVILNHGYGLTTTYSHMQDVWVVEGQALRQGEPLGTVGATGRATGAHLDWRVNWFDQRLDPALLVPPMPPPVSE
jgi:murein DD-endopeptidase MepM/ murein hydrolase activator NlpD